MEIGAKFKVGDRVQWGPTTPLIGLRKPSIGTILVTSQEQRMGRRIAPGCVRVRWDDVKYAVTVREALLEVV